MSYGIAASYGHAGSGGGTALPEWDALPAGSAGDRLNATLDSAPIVAERGASLWHPAYPTAAQLAALWPSSEQWSGVRVGTMHKVWRAKSEGRPLRVMVIGDSTTVGQGAIADNVGCRAYSWPVLLAQRFGWRDGTCCANGLPNADPRVTPGGWVNAVKEMPGSCWAATSQTDLVFTPGVPFDRLIVTGVAVAGNFAEVTVLVDGASVGTYWCEPSYSGNTNLPVLDVAVTRGTHTVTVRASASGNSYLNTIETRDSQSTAPELLHMGIADANIDNHISTALYGPRARYALLRPDIALFSGTINDLDDSYSVADTIIPGFRTLKAILSEVGCSFVGVGGWATLRPLVTAANLDLLNAELLTLSQADGHGYVDVRGHLGRDGSAMDPSLIADDWHLSADGYAEFTVPVGRLFE